MTAVVFQKLLAIFLTVLLGWAAGRWRWLGAAGPGAADPGRWLSQAAFAIFVPALLFRTTAGLDLAALPWGTVAAYFVPVVGLLLAVYAWQHRRPRAAQDAAAPAVHAISATFGNTVQLGLPMAAALFGEAGLSIHIALVSVHALILLSVATVLVELDLARARTRSGQGSVLWSTLAHTVRHTLIHPVVLPVLLGLLCNLAGLSLHPVLDETLRALGAAVVPVCLVAIGLTLAHDPLQRHQLRGVLQACALKLFVQPALVLVLARWGFGLSGLPLSVAVLMAALPAGSNTLMFAQRYRSLASEANAGIVLSTVAFALTASLWLALLAWLPAA